LAEGVVVETMTLSLRITNQGDAPADILSWSALEVTLDPDASGPAGHDLWAYCGASHPDRPDWLRPVDPGFHEPGWLGMSDSDYGGGNPIAVLWGSLRAVAVGLLSLVPEVVSLPIQRPSSGPARMEIRGPDEVAGRRLLPGDSWSPPDLWCASANHDGLVLLRAWRLALERRGLVARRPSEASREPTWCAWGYERAFTLAQVEGALPKVADLGIRWVTLDDGWQSEEGDVTLNPAKFPQGEAQMRAFVEGVHARGLKAMLWWIPLAADPRSHWFANHPDTVIRNSEGEPSLVTFWDCWTLCPSHPAVRDEIRRQLQVFFRDWGFDGLKIDGQHLNGMPPCHDPSHRHRDPGVPHRELPAFWQMVQETAEDLCPGATVLLCPCGTPYSVHAMPHFDVPVASDPDSSWQVRTKGLVFKALMAPDCAYHGDHVELSDREIDFGSTLGVGGIPDTKFTWPPGSGNPSMLKPGGNFDLLPEAEPRVRSWFEAWRRERLDRLPLVFGHHRFGFDPVEAHVFVGDRRRYHSFFALPNPGTEPLEALWDGPVEFRGLPPGTWHVWAWAEGTETVQRFLGVVSQESPVLPLRFMGSLLTRLDLC